MVGMGAMVGGGTGAAMTAVAMIFEMTRDYDIVLPMILAVAVALGVRRMLSRENIYTMKLVRRGHPIPQALHANMFLVRRARDVMERDIVLIDEAASFDEFLRRHGQRRRAAPRGGDARRPHRRRDPRQHRLQAHARRRRAAWARSRGATSPSCARAAWCSTSSRACGGGAAMAALVVAGSRASPRAGTVLGVITKEHVADAVASSVRIYPR